MVKKRVENLNVRATVDGELGLLSPENWTINIKGKKTWDR